MLIVSSEIRVRPCMLRTATTRQLQQGWAMICQRSQSGALLDKQGLIDEHQVKLHFFSRVGGEGWFGKNLHQAVADGKRKESITCIIRCFGRQPAVMFGIKIVNEADVTRSHPRQAGQNLVQIISKFLRITVRRMVGSNLPVLKNDLRKC